MRRSEPADPAAATDPRHTSVGSRWWGERRAPLELIDSIKTRWSIVIVAAVAVTALFSQVGVQLGWPIWLRPLVAGALALAAVQYLAHGMTAPLRAMADAASRMARGDYSARVEATGNDEVAELAAAFRSMAAELAETDRLQKEFIANASHELRTPVAALLATLENLVDGIEHADRDTLGRMLAQADHLGRLVTQLLDLSRIEAAADVRRSPVDIGDLLHQLVAEQQLMDPLANVEVKAPLGLRVLGDERRLRSLFANLLANAVRFSEHGSPVTVTASRQADDVRVAVRDQGPGIDPDVRHRVFERFWQADGAAPTGRGGAGLGLSIGKRIVDQHGGTIAVDDNHPKGACLVVTLPRWIEAPNVGASAASASAAPTVAARSGDRAEISPGARRSR